MNAIKGKPFPVYGKGDNVRDWLYVEDHTCVLCYVLVEGKTGETYYDIGGLNERTNVEVVRTLGSILDELVPEHPNGITRYEELIKFVADRPGHDHRYAIDASKTERELGWRPMETFESGIRKTVEWYLNNERWLANVTTGAYRELLSKQYTA